MVFKWILVVPGCRSGALVAPLGLPWATFGDTRVFQKSDKVTKKARLEHSVRGELLQEGNRTGQERVNVVKT